MKERGVPNARSPIKTDGAEGAVTFGYFNLYILDQEASIPIRIYDFNSVKEILMFDQ